MGSLTIRFSKEYSAVAALASERRKEIGSSLEALLGHPVTIQVIVDESVDVPMATRKRMAQELLANKREEEARQHPLVRQVQAELGGAVTEIRVNDK